MCGVAGILVQPEREQIELHELRRMAAMLRHRGPDGLGFYLDDHVGLAHTRLSIIDWAGGAQPMANEDGRIWITFNGEIFNYIELKAELEGFGHRFRTRSDTEVIIHAYEQWGDDAWARFNGQFALALWDSRLRQLWLVRDRLGILPLFYTVSAGRMVFGSEVKAIFASKHRRPQFDPGGLRTVFTLWSIPAPQTVFQDIQSVEPGCAICFDERLNSRSSKYWTPAFDLLNSLNPPQLSETADELEHRLKEAVRIRLRADVPVGTYLSGGLDSSLIAGLARLIGTAPLQTFGIRFEDAAYDETPYQRRMAAMLGTTHHEIACGPDEIQDALRDVVWSCETPLLRTAPAPMFVLSKFVRDHGIKVVLTGEGADEFLAGYDIFKEGMIRRFWSRNPDSIMRPALLAKLHQHVGADRPANDMWQSFFQRGLTQVDDPYYSHWIRWENTQWITRFLGEPIRSNDGVQTLLADIETQMPQAWRMCGPLEQAQMIEIVTFLSSYLLCSQGDRVSMAHGVEARYPYLDPEFVDACTRLPSRHKLRGMKDKFVLRKVAERYLPADICRRPKFAYRAPIMSALFGPNPPEYVRELLSPSCLNRLGMADPKPVTALFAKARSQFGRISEREEMALVGILTVQMLAVQYLEEFDSRAQSLVQGVAPVRAAVLEDRRSTLRAVTSDRTADAA